MLFRSAEDLLRYLPGSRTGSVHVELFPEVDHLADPALVATWSRLLGVRDQVNAALEQKRKDKVIGNSLSAHVTLTASGPVAATLGQYRAYLPTLFIVSDLEVQLGAIDGPDTVTVAVDKARGTKCDRCWRFVPHVRTEPAWTGICDRCVDALAEPVKS